MVSFPHKWSHWLWKSPWPPPEQVLTSERVEVNHGSKNFVEFGFDHLHKQYKGNYTIIQGTVLCTGSVFSLVGAKGYIFMDNTGPRHRTFYSWNFGILYWHHITHKHRAHCNLLWAGPYATGVIIITIVVRWFSCALLPSAPCIYSNQQNWALFSDPMLIYSMVLYDTRSSNVLTPCITISSYYI